MDPEFTSFSKGLKDVNSLMGLKCNKANLTASFSFVSSSLCVFQLSLAEEQSEVSRNGLESKELVYLVHIYCQVWQLSVFF